MIHNKGMHAQPRSQRVPDGKLASLIFDDDDRLHNVASDSTDIARSTSAPPTEMFHNLVSTQREKDLRSRPEYAAFFHQNSRLDPRLPPPPYIPGQSWQLWSSSALNLSENGMAEWEKRKKPPTFSATPLDSLELRRTQTPALSGRKKLVDMIQEDFPRTPSPAVMFQAERQSRAIPCGFQFSEDRLDEENDTQSRLTDLYLDNGDIFEIESNGIGSIYEKLGGKHQANTDPSLATSERVNSIQRTRPGSESGKEEPAKGRSAILEDFRTNKNRRYEVKDILGHVVEFSEDQHGSRYIQQKLESSGTEDRKLIFEEILPKALELMTDVFGNYVIQKFFELGTMEQKVLFVKKMVGHIVELSLQMYGCRVVQKALEHLDSEHQEIVVCELNRHVLGCVKDQNGNHVIQKCIEKVSPALVSCIVDSFRGHVYVLATHPYGCRVIQRIFEHCSEAQSRPIMEELHRSSCNLIQDQYGNYVIQHILERGDKKDKTMVISKIKGNLLSLSCHKFASNVVEKCVAFGSLDDRRDFVQEMVCVRPDGIVPLHVMMKDQFANYVIQKMLDVVQGQELDLLVQKIRSQTPFLKKYTYGKHIISKVEKLHSGGSK